MSKRFNKYLLKIGKGKEDEVAAAIGYPATQYPKDMIENFPREISVTEAVNISKLVAVSPVDLLHEQIKCQLEDVGYKEPKQAAAPKVEKTQRDLIPSRSPMYVDEKPRIGRCVSLKL